MLGWQRYQRVGEGFSFVENLEMIPAVRIRKLSSSAFLALLLICLPAVNASARNDDGSADKSKTATTKKSPPGTNTKSTTHSASSKKRHKKTTRVRGQEKIDPERAQQIQEALIREHYLSGEATGHWNQTTEDALRRYQADNGWQSKTVPDSRALIKLGLGPSKDHLLNPDSAMTTVPDPPKSNSAPPASHSAPPVTTPTQPVVPVSTPPSSSSGPQ